MLVFRKQSCLHFALALALALALCIYTFHLHVAFALSACTLRQRFVDIWNCFKSVPKKWIVMSTKRWCKVQVQNEDAKCKHDYFRKSNIVVFHHRESLKCKLNEMKVKNVRNWLRSIWLRFCKIKVLGLQIVALSTQSILILICPISKLSWQEIVKNDQYTVG